MFHSSISSLRVDPLGKKEKLFHKRNNSNFGTNLMEATPQIWLVLVNKENSSLLRRIPLFQVFTFKSLSHSLFSWLLPSTSTPLIASKETHNLFPTFQPWDFPFFVFPSTFSPFSPNPRIAAFDPQHNAFLKQFDASIPIFRWPHVAN